MAGNNFVVLCSCLSYECYLCWCFKGDFGIFFVWSIWLRIFCSVMSCFIFSVLPLLMLKENFGKRIFKEKENFFIWNVWHVWRYLSWCFKVNFGLFFFWNVWLTILCTVVWWLILSMLPLLLFQSAFWNFLVLFRDLSCQCHLCWCFKLQLGIFFVLNVWLRIFFEVLFRALSCECYLIDVSKCIFFRRKHMTQDSFVVWLIFSVLPLMMFEIAFWKFFVGIIRWKTL
jgi:hypothetical protein